MWGRGEGTFLKKGFPPPRPHLSPSQDFRLLGRGGEEAMPERISIFPRKENRPRNGTPAARPACPPYFSNRDSINTKVFGKGGMGFVEGRGNFSEEKFPLPSPIFPTYSIYPAIKRLSAHPGHSRRTADAAENGQARAKGPHSCRERRAWPLPDHRSRNCSPRRSGSCPARP